MARKKCPGMEEEAVNLTVINEEIRTRKHTMRLCLGTDSDDKNGANIAVGEFKGLSKSLPDSLLIQVLCLL